MPAVDGQSIFGHSQRHTWVVAGLKLNVDQVPGVSSPQKIDMAGTDFRKFRAEPLGDSEACESGEEAALQLALQQRFQRDVELVHRSTRK